MAVPLQWASGTWQSVDFSPSGTATFPEGGGTCSTGLLVPADGLVKDTSLNVTGSPIYTNGTWSNNSDNLWANAQNNTNLTLSQNGIGLGGFGSWWEETGAEAWGRAPDEDKSEWPTIGVNGSVLDNWTLDENGNLRLAREFEKPYTIDINTIGLWHLDEGQGSMAKDASGFKNDGTVYQTANWVDGEFKTALFFKGGYVDLDNIPAPTTTGTDVTVEFWMNWQGPLVADQLILGWQLYDIAIGKHYIGFNTGAADVFGCSSDGLINKWVNVCAIFHNGDPTASRLFFNGIEQQLSQYVGSPMNSRAYAGSSFRISGWRDITNYRFNGTIDELRMLNGSRPSTASFASKQASILSPVLNVSAYSRVMVQGEFPNGTNYTVDVLDPAANNTTLQSGLQNGDELNLSLWAGQNSSYRNLVMKLTVNTSDANLTPVIKKWGIGTGYRGKSNLSLPIDITNWTRCATNPILTLGPPGSWNDKGLGWLSIIKMDNIYKMWYTGGNTSINEYLVGYATSKDGISWSDYASNPIFSPTGTSTWDGSNLEVDCVLFNGTGYRMYYSANGPSTSGIGLATSSDGISWNRYSGNPLLTTSSGWESGYATSPSVVYYQGQYIMAYTGGDATRFSIGIAISPDGISWTEYSSNPVLRTNGSVLYPSLSKFGDELIMAYEDSVTPNVEVPGGGVIKLVNSTDGFNWTPVKNEGILSPQGSGWESRRLTNPFIYFENEKDRAKIWYIAEDSVRTESIGLAFSNYQPAMNFEEHITPIYDTYGNLFVNATLPNGTGFWVNITDESNNTLLSYLKNGDPILLNATAYPEIQLNLTLWTNDTNITPVINDWGYGLQAIEPFMENGSQYNSSNISISDGLRLASDNWQWAQIANGPGARGYHGAVWDDQNQQMIIFGGSSTNPVMLNDTWIYYPSNDTWSKMADGPTAAYYASAWDPKNHQMLVFGGSTSSSTDSNELWSYSPADNTWTQLASGPTQRHGPTGVWDSLKERFLIYGGRHHGEISKNDLWAYYPDNDTWIQLSDGPSARQSAVSVFDPIDNQMIVYGGYEADTGGGIIARYNDTWAYDSMSETWSQQLDGPSIYRDGSAVWDERGQRMIIFGGANATDVLNGTWAFSPSSNSWTQLDSGPLARDYLSGVWNSNADDMIIFGGYDGSNWLNDTWKYFQPYVPDGRFNSQVNQLPVIPNNIGISTKTIIPNNTMITITMCLSSDNQTWSDWINVTPNQIYYPSNFTNWGPYVQYNITLNTSDQNVTPILWDFRISYCPYLLNATLTPNQDITVLEGNISSAKPILDCSIPAGCYLNITLSADNGTSWQEFSNDSSANFTSKGNTLWWKLSYSSDGNGTPLLSNFTIEYVIEHYPNNVSIDIGGDGTLDWNYTGQLTDTEPGGNLTNALNTYISAHRSEADANGYLTVPVNISSDTGGIVNLSDARIDFAPTPHILDYSPKGVDVLLDTPITISFNQSMDAVSITPVSLIIFPSVNWTASWSSDMKNLKLSHAKELQENTTYTVILAAGKIFSAEGTPTLDIFSWNFTTCSLPQVIDYSPRDADVPMNSSIGLSFNVSMDTTSVANMLTISPTINNPSFVWSDNNKTLNIVHSDFLENTTYNVTLKANTLSKVNAPMKSDFSWVFTTFIIPEIKNVAPTGNDVPLNASITIDFNISMYPLSVVNSISITPSLNLTFDWSPDYKTFTITHPDFAENTSYTVLLKAGSLSTKNAVLKTDFSWSFRTWIMPRIVRVSPEGNNTILDTPIVITFNISMNRSSVEQSINISPPLNINFSWSADNTTVTITHEGLKQNTTYNVTIMPSIFSSVGAPFNDTYSWEFRTIPPPKILGSSPTGTNVSLRTNITISFNEAMNESAVIVEIMPPLMGNTSWSVNGTFMSIDPGYLVENQTYAVTVMASSRSLRGAILESEYTWTFKTVLPIPDAPKIIDWDPKGTNTSLNPAIMVSFDKKMDTASVFSAISLNPHVDFSGFTYFNTTYNFTITGELLPGTTYTVTISTTAKNDAGTPLTIPFTWNFTTNNGGKDTILPTILFTSPLDGDTGVDRNITVVIVFSEPMDQEPTINSFSISPAINRTFKWLDDKGVILQFKPNGIFRNVTYTISFDSTKAKDVSGNPLDGNRNGKADGTGDDYSFKFSVVWPPGPKLVSRAPEGSKIKLTEPIRLTFNRGMNLSSIATAFSVQPAINGSWTISTDGTVATFTPSSKHHPHWTYQVNLAGDAADIEGIPMGIATSWVFKTVAPAPTQKAEFPWWIAIILIVAIVGAVAYWRVRKKNEEQITPVEEQTGVTPEVITVSEDATVQAVEPLPEAPPILAPGPSSQPIGRASTEGSRATRGVQFQKAAAEASIIALTQAEAPLGFSVEDVFLIYYDGRLIQHTTRRMKADMDADVMVSMFTAVKDFVRDSLGMADGTELGAMEYGENKILLQKGKWVVLAVVIAGKEPAGLREEIKTIVSNIEGEYGATLKTWNGQASKLDGVKKFLSELGTYKTAEIITEERPSLLVSMKGELEFYQGFVRLKVAVKNDMPMLIVEASFRLVYNRNALRLDHIEPEYPFEEGDVKFGNVKPHEKVAVAFYLDPQICTESYIEGVLTFRDANDNLETVKLKKTRASVVCPIMYTDENINTAMLKRMSAEELDKKDVKIFSIPTNMTQDKAFDMAKSAVQHHDVRLVREFKEKTPYIGEAWYYGKAKGREDRMVIRARVLGEKNMLEFYVASNSTLMLTGMLAELKADLNKELSALRGRPVMMQVTRPEQVDAVTQIRSLLDMEAEAETAAGETEPIK